MEPNVALCEAGKTEGDKSVLESLLFLSAPPNLDDEAAEATTRTHTPQVMIARAWWLHAAPHAAVLGARGSYLNRAGGTVGHHIPGAVRKPVSESVSPAPVTERLSVDPGSTPSLDNPHPRPRSL